MNRGHRIASPLPRLPRGEAYLRSGVRAVVERSTAFVVCIAIFPVLALVSLLVWALDGRPVLFRQQRIGLFGTPFTLLKFRTMRSPSDADSELLDSESRVTRLGALLRRTSLDELPALMNVVRGEMSLVGPRPLLAVHKDLYANSHPERLLARPGLTGLAQVSGRRELTFQQRFDLDVQYVATASWGLDAEICIRTVGALVRSISRPSVGGMSQVDDIGLADAIGRHSPSSSPEQEAFRQPNGPVGSEGADAPALASRRGGLPSALREAHVVFGTFGQAMVAIIGSAPRVHLPSYYCPDVVERLREALEGRIVRYDDHPLSTSSTVEAADDDVVVLLPHFGRPTRVSVQGGRLLLDATYTFGSSAADFTDAAGRTADVCVASLRETLPVSDGALIWSPSGGTLPAQPPLHASHAATARKLEGALMAQAALLAGETEAGSGEIVESLADAVAELESSTAPSAALPQTVERLRRFDFEARWAARERNRRVAIERLEQLKLVGRRGELQVFDAPFMLILVAPTPVDRERIREGLIARDVVPTVLWSHSHLKAESPERDFGARMLALDVDARYSTDDMVRVVETLLAVVRSEVSSVDGAR